MPIYTYRCKDCDYFFEQNQRMTDDPLADCPRCAGNVRRVVNSVGVVFKGSGFYVTDNRKDKAQSAANNNGAVAESSNGNSESAQDDSSTAATPKAEKTAD